MSYYEQASQINTNLKRFFNEIKLDGGDVYLADLLNQIIRFGQVAKFRCRSNAAYDNFVSECLKDIATVKRTPLDGKEFEVLQITGIKIKEKEISEEELKQLFLKAHEEGKINIVNMEAL